MKEPYVKGRLHHHGPESCVYSREAMGEAVDRGSVGQLLSSEITNFRVPTLWTDGEGNTV